MALSRVPSETNPSGAQPLPSFARLKEVINGQRPPRDLAEAAQVLTELARRKAGRLPASLLVEQVLKVTDGTDWPARRAALEALLRRLGFAARDELEIAQRPPHAAVFGRYVLSGRAGPELGQARRERSRAPRPYHTQVYALTPLHGSCDCPDFLRSSLGLCKHLLVVLEDLAAPARKGEPRARDPRAEPALALPALRWDPVRSWTGQGDRLLGLSWDAAQSAAGTAQPAEAELRDQLFERLEAAFEAGRLSSSARDEIERRVELLEDLSTALDQGWAEAEPAAARLISLELELARRRSAARAAAPELLDQLQSLRRSLYPYQREGIERFLCEQRLLLADDMGLGKTTQAIAACHALVESGRVTRGLLIVPASLKEQWLREWEATTSRVSLVAVDGSAQERARLYEQTERGFLVMNYEQLLRDLEGVQRFDPEVVVLDEAQRIKNWATKSSAYVMSLQPAWRLVLTGTPMENRLEELATLLDWVDDAALAPKWRLLPWHTTWNDSGSERLGARHLDTLRQRLSPCMLRRVRRDVLSQLPPRTDVRVPVPMTSQQREEHDALVPPIARLLQTGRQRPLAQAEFLKLMQLLTQQRVISNGLALFHFEEVWPTYDGARADDALLGSTCSPKLVEFRRLISDLVLNQERKVVVFSQWRRMLRLCEWAVRDLLEQHGLRSLFFTGQESQKLRTRNITEFHDDPGAVVLFATDAGGVGLNLQHAANACINLEVPWNPAVLEQRIGRIYRLGQAHPIDVINLVTEYGIEARIAALVGNKRALFSGLFDGTTDAVRFDGPSNFLSHVEQLVEPLPPVPFTADGESAELSLDLSLDDDDDADVDDEASAHQPLTEHDQPSQTLASPADPTFTEPTFTGSMAPELGGEPTPTRLGSALVASAQPGTVDPSAPSTSLPNVTSLFERITVTRLENGGLRLEASPEAADELLRLVQGLEALLRSAEAPPKRS
jgi:hypothetical protein